MIKRLKAAYLAFIRPHLIAQTDDYWEMCHNLRARRMIITEIEYVGNHRLPINKVIEIEQAEAIRRYLQGFN